MSHTHFPAFGKKNLSLLALGVLSMLFLTSCQNYGTKMTFGKCHLYYTDKVKKEEAEKLGEYLKKAEFFTDSNEIDAQINKEGNTYQLRYPVKKEFLDKPEYADIAKQFVAMIKADVFNGSDVEIHFTDDVLKTIKVLK